MTDGLQVRVRPPKDAPDELLELIGRCYKENPDKKDLQGLREYLEEKPNLFRAVIDLAKIVQDKLIEDIIHQPAGQVGIEAQINNIRIEMAYEESSVLERLLIDNIINCWLRLQWVEIQLSGQSNEEQVSLRIVEYWEKRLSASQRRYLRACDTLARVRKLTRNTPMLQVNIATESGQQVNIAGDIVKNGSPD
ncbi:hypothetical protein ACFLV7_00910 [Chloroflexota bacterium]